MRRSRLDELHHEGQRLHRHAGLVKFFQDLGDIGAASLV